MNNLDKLAEEYASQFNREQTDSNSLYYYSQDDFKAGAKAILDEVIPLLQTAMNTAEYMDDYHKIKNFLKKYEN